MGNYTSCCFNNSHNSEAARIVDSEGNVREVSVQVKAGELMIEEAGKAVCLMKELKSSGRVVAVKAESGLLEGEVYMLVALSRVHCKVSEAEMKIVNAHCCDEHQKWSRRNRKRRGSAKVLPAVTVESERDERKDFEESSTGSLGCRLGNCRHWTPVLEPILEEF